MADSTGFYRHPFRLLRDGLTFLAVQFTADHEPCVACGGAPKRDIWGMLRESWDRRLTSMASQCANVEM